MNEMQVFSYGEMAVEVVVLDGKELFNATQVREILDLNKQSVGNLDAKYKVTVSKSDYSKYIDSVLSDSNVTIDVLTNIPNRGLTFLTEAGVYKLIFKSRKEEAEQFQDWVTDEVLPQIRKTGGYIPVAQDDDDMTIMAKALQIMQNTLQKKDELIAQQQPKVEYFDTVLCSSKLSTMTDVAKDLGMTATKLNKVLNEKGVIYKTGKTWKTYARYDGMIPEYFDYHITVHGQTLKVTEKGRQWIIDLLKGC